jgi:phosphoglycerol transferase
LSFLCLTCVAVLLDKAWKRMASSRRGELAMCGMLMGLVVLGLADQHPRSYRPNYENITKEWNQDAKFVAQIESVLPADSMVFQLPVLRYPEEPPIHKHGSYMSLRYYLHTANLRWSSGAMKSRQADQFQQKVAKLPLAEQLPALVEAGFKGIQISRRGYPDNAEQLEAQLRELTGEEPIVSDDNQDLFFALQAAPERLPATDEQRLSSFDNDKVGHPELGRGEPGRAEVVTARNNGDED